MELSSWAVDGTQFPVSRNGEEARDYLMVPTYHTDNVTFTFT